MKKYLLLLFAFVTYCSVVGQNAPNVFINIDPPLPICNIGDCTTLQANFLQTYSTNSNTYTVNPITYAPGFPFTGGTILNVTIDDTWSPIVDLPFPFCFYGQNYTKVLAGSNGLVTFDIAGVVPGGTQVPIVAGGCEWDFADLISPTGPNTNFPIKNSIYGVYQDIHPGLITNPTAQNINYYVTGTAPNRAFVLNTTEIPQFGCNLSVGTQTYQIILYETTNVIDVLVSKRTSCISWNGGPGVIGIMNQSGSLATVPPTRNTGTWSAFNEAWRFEPSNTGVSNVAIEWFNGATSLGSGISTGLGTNTLNVCPTSSTTYTARATYTRCDGSLITIQDLETVSPGAPLPLNNPVDINVCTAAAPPYIVNINQNAAMLGALNANNYDIIYHLGTTTGPIIPNATLNTYNITSPAPSTTIFWVEMVDLFGTGCTNFRSFNVNMLTGPSGTISYPTAPFCNSISTPQPVTSTTNYTGTYSATPSGLTINSTTGAITPSLSTPNTYTVTSSILASGTCPAYSTSTSVTINPLPATPTRPVTQPPC